MQKIVLKTMTNNMETTNRTVHRVTCPIITPKQSALITETLQPDLTQGTAPPECHRLTTRSMSSRVSKEWKTKKGQNKTKQAISQKKGKTDIESEKLHDEIDESNSDSNFSDDHHCEIEEHKFCDNNTLSQNKKQRTEDRDTIINFTFVS